MDESRKILLINKALRVLTGFSNDEARGLHCYQVLRSSLCMKNCPVWHAGRDFETTLKESDIINRNRQLIPVNQTISPLKNLNGKRIGFMETVEDLRSIKELDAKTDHAFKFANLVGRSPQMEKVYQVLPILAQSDSSVLITGETGTGKDLLAEALHQSSNRSKGPFVKVNCGALPESLLESELFGHQKGAFTGAVESKAGRFRLAHNGTLFLTEIGDLPLTLQVKLLTFLDDQVIYPLGSNKGFQANVRVMAGTHRDLEAMVAQGSFRSDLLFRLNVVRIHLPPLREREGDLHLLADHFLNTLNSKFQKRIQGFSNDAFHLLSEYGFPGNVRELRNIVEYAVNICEESLIQIKHLPSYLLDEKEEHPNPPVEEPIEKERAVPVNVPQKQNATWEETERELIIDALKKSGGRRNEAADMLGWGRSTLWRKMKKHGLNN